MTWFSPELAPLLAIAVASLDENGTLIEANAGFLRLISVDKPQQIGAHVAEFFIQPNFASLLRAPLGAEGEIHRGLLTVGAYAGQTRSVRARVWREQARLRVLAEYDIEDLERLNNAVLELNRDYAGAQFELAQTNLKMQQLNAVLEQRVEARTLALRNALVAAEVASHAKSAFLVNMSHEIRTPMNGVIGMIDVLQQSSLKSDQVEMVELIRESAISLLGIIEDTLDFSRIEAGKLELEQEAIAASDVVEGVCSMLNAMAAKKHVALTCYIDSSIPARVLGDAPRLRQVLGNLVNNAIKFSSGQSRAGTVSLRAMLIEKSSDKVTVEFQVIDNGIGMDDETQARLFSAFTQADVSTTRRFGGAGLGLTIAKHLVELMGGKLTVQSALGEGATFKVWLPFAPLRAEAGAVEMTAAVAAGPAPREVESKAAACITRERAAVAPSREQARQLGRLILVAEDNETNQKVIVRQLALLGYTADVAANGLEALRLWRSGDYALLLTDLHMPEMDGYDLSKAVRDEEKGGRRMPIIALTANALKGEAEHCRSVGIDDYRTKPSQLPDLKALLGKWLPITQVAAEAIAWHGLPTPSEPQDTSAVPVDVSVLEALVGDDPALIHEFLQDFRSSAAKIAVEVRAACAANQAKDAAAAAHKLKSAARSVGALALGELCADMEKEGNAGDSDALSVLLPRFEAEMAVVESYLDARIVNATVESQSH